MPDPPNSAHDPPPVPQTVLPPIPPQPPRHKTPGQALDAALAVVLRLARACARGWSALDWRGRFFVVCGVGLAVVILATSRITLFGLAVAAILAFAWQLRLWRALNWHGRLIVVCGGFALVALLALILAGSSDKAAREPSASISAVALWQQYGSNALAVDAKYKDRELLMSGGVHEVGKARDGRYYVGFYVVLSGAVDESTYDNMSARERRWWAEGYPPNVICYLAKGSEQDFAGVQPGDNVRVRAKVVGVKQTDDVWRGYIVELEGGELVK